VEQRRDKSAYTIPAAFVAGALAISALNGAEGTTPAETLQDINLQDSGITCWIESVGYNNVPTTPDQNVLGVELAVYGLDDAEYGENIHSSLEYEAIRGKSKVLEGGSSIGSRGNTFGRVEMRDDKPYYGRVAVDFDFDRDVDADYDVSVSVQQQFVDMETGASFSGPQIDCSKQDFVFVEKEGELVLVTSRQIEVKVCDTDEDKIVTIKHDEGNVITHPYSANLNDCQ